MLLVLLVRPLRPAPVDLPGDPPCVGCPITTAEVEPIVVIMLGSLS